MTQHNGLQRIAAHFDAEEQRLLGLIGKLSEEQRQLQLQLDHVRSLKSSLAGTPASDAVLSPAATPETAAKAAPAAEPPAAEEAAPEAPAPAPTTTRKPRKAASTRRKAASKQPSRTSSSARKTKGARPQSATTQSAAPDATTADNPKPAKSKNKGKGTTAAAAAALGDMSIVDAAIHFATKNGKDTVDSGEIQKWFAEGGFETRTGVPNRNSIYVSLNRERHQGAKAGRNRVVYVERGIFRFPEVTEKLEGSSKDN